MNFILTDAQPPLLEVSKLKGKAAQVYGVLWQSAVQDVRGDCGGTTEWSIKGIADFTGSCRKAVRKALCVLLDSGLISAENYVASEVGSEHTIFRVTHPNQLEAVRHAISIMGSPSIRWQNRLKGFRAANPV